MNHLSSKKGLFSFPRVMAPFEAVYSHLKTVFMYVVNIGGFRRNKRLKCFGPVEVDTGWWIFVCFKWPCSQP